MADFSGKTAKFPKCHALTANVQREREILEISHLAIMRHNLMLKVGPMAKFSQMPWL